MSGKLRLWLDLIRQKDGSRRPPSDRDYLFGIDISAGTGASASVISIGETLEKRKIGEYADANIRPERFAALAVALAKWFCNQHGDGAHMIWEAAGPGTSFGGQVIDLGYRNIYYRTNESSLSKKVSDTPGWYQTGTAKRDLLTEYRRALVSGEFLQPSKEALQECREYIYSVTGTVEHRRAVARGAGELDPSGARANHGDRVIADALLWHLLRGYVMRVAEKEEKDDLEDNPPKGSYAWRRREFEKQKELAERWDYAASYAAS